MSEPNNRRTWIARALALSVTLYLVSQLMPLPGGAGILIVVGLVLGWLWVAARWLVERFGRTAVIALGIAGACIVGIMTTINWLDTPNRRLAGKIEQIPGCYTTTNGGLVTGKIDHVYISANATDRDVYKFIELDKFEELSILFLDGPQLTDATAIALVRLQSLRYLTLAGTGVSEEVAENLRRKLPNCIVNVK